MDLNVSERTRAKHFLKRLYKIARPLKRDDLAARPNNFGKIDSGVPRTRAYVENVFASSNAGSLPAIQDDGPPYIVLQTQPGNFFLVCTEKVIAVG